MIFFRRHTIAIILQTSPHSEIKVFQTICQRQNSKALPGCVVDCNIVFIKKSKNRFSKKEPFLSVSIITLKSFDTYPHHHCSSAYRSSNCQKKNFNALCHHNIIFSFAHQKHSSNVIALRKTFCLRVCFVKYRSQHVGLSFCRVLCAFGLAHRF